MRCVTIVKKISMLQTFFQRRDIVGQHVNQLLPGLRQVKFPQVGIDVAFAMPVDQAIADQAAGNETISPVS